MLKKAPVLACLIALVVAATAYAGAPNRSTSSISIKYMTQAGQVTTATEAVYGNTVTFTQHTTQTDQPFVHLQCYQGGTLVLESWQGFFATALGSQQFNLGPSPAWTGGAGNCTATLENWDSYSKNGKIVALAATSFPVAA
jgi:hypothetical protein